MTAEQDRPPLSSEVKRLEGVVGLHPHSTQVKRQLLLRAWQVTTFALTIAASVWVAMGFVYTPRAGGSNVRLVLGYFYDHSASTAAPVDVATMRAGSPAITLSSSSTPRRSLSAFRQTDSYRPMPRSSRM